MQTDGKSFSQIISQIEEVARLVDAVVTVASSRVPVLLLGPASTGIDLLAQAIHASSPRCSRPFVIVRAGLESGSLCESQHFAEAPVSPRRHTRSRTGCNCIESANGGTLFIDQIQNATRATQLEILQLISDQVYGDSSRGNRYRTDVRIVASAWTDLQQRSSEGRFRPDLFDRLNTVVLEVRKGCSTREWFFEAFSFLRAGILAQENAAGRLSASDLAFEVNRYAWSPVVATLQHAIRETLRGASVLDSSAEFFFAVLRTIGHRQAEHLAHHHLQAVSSAVERCVDTYEFFGGKMYATLQGQMQRALIQRVMIQCNGTLSRAAGVLGMSIQLLESKLYELGLDATASRTA